MFLETLVLALSMASAAAPARPNLEGWAAPLLAPTFRPAARAVGNWRWQGALHLGLDLEKSIGLALGRDPAGLSRCVRLNNYWCVKKAGWRGELAADADGHVAFASAREGALAALALLRRYYTIYNLKSARAIVSRWAPPGCGAISGLVARAGSQAGLRAGGRPLGIRKPLGPEPARRAEPKGLTTQGLGATLRARFLAARGGRIAGGAKVKAARLIRSRVPDKTPRLMATPIISTGISSSASPKSRVSVLITPLGVSGLMLGPEPGGKPPPLSSCANDGARIANYAGKLAAGVAASADADLNLFDAEGQPQPALARALLNMAAVEIGPLSAREELVLSALRAAYPEHNFSAPQSEAHKTDAP